MVGRRVCSCTRHRDMLAQILPASCVDRCILAERSGSWIDADADVQTLVHAGDLGKSLFKKRQGTVKGTHFSAKVQKSIAAFAAMPDTAKMLCLHTTRTDLAEIAAMASADECFEPAAFVNVTYTYLEGVVRIPTGCASMEVNVRLEALLRSCSVGYAGGVQPLAHERWLVGHRADVPAPIPASAMNENEIAREQFCIGARRGAHEQLCQLVGLVDSEKKRKSYTDHDPFFTIETKFLQHCAERVCNTWLRTSVFSSLPNGSRDIALPQAILAMQTLRQTPLVMEGQLVESIQLLDAVEEELGLLTNSVGPDLGADPTASRVARFSAYSGFFCCDIMLRRPGQADGKKTLRGKQGFHTAWRLIREKFATDPSSVQFATLRCFSGFHWLMGQDGTAELRAWMQRAQQNAEDREDDNEDFLMMDAMSEAASSPTRLNDDSPLCKRNTQAKSTPKKQVVASGGVEHSDQGSAAKTTSCRKRRKTADPSTRVAVAEKSPGQAVE